MSAIFDKNLELRDVADGAETATAAETGIAFDPVHIGEYEAVVHVTAIDAADADETYVLTVETDSLVAFTDAPVVIASLAVDKATAVPTKIRIPLNGAKTKFLDPNAAAIRIKATLGGTTPSITYGAYLTKSGAGEGEAKDLA